jgi:hypothetical protein
MTTQEWEVVMVSDPKSGFDFIFRVQPIPMSGEYFFVKVPWDAPLTEETITATVWEEFEDPSLVRSVSLGPGIKEVLLV